MKPQTLIILAVSLGCGLAAWFLTNKYLTPQETNPRENYIPVVCAAVDIPGGQAISDTMVKMVEFPKENLPDGFVTDLKKVVGRAARYPINPKVVVTDKMLAAEGVSAGLEPVIGEGMRAVSVPITTEGGVAGFIKPDSHVDIMLIVQSRGKEQPAVAATILQDVRVLAVNSEMQNNTGANPEHKGVVVENVTMLLTPDDSLKLALAQKNGTLQLMLRNRKEKGETKRSVVSLDDVLASRNGEEKDEDKEPEKVMAEEGSEGVMDVLNKLGVAKDGKKPVEAEKQPTQISQPIPPPPPTETVQVPRKNLKRLVYRDLEGNPVMEVLVDADSKMGKTLEQDHLLENVDSEPSEDFSEPSVN
ncbi:MAG: Flp pilus assembly protein CpaB [Planctomycetota bacterium]